MEGGKVLLTQADGADSGLYDLSQDAESFLRVAVLNRLDGLGGEYHRQQVVFAQLHSLLSRGHTSTLENQVFDCP